MLNEEAFREKVRGNVSKGLAPCHGVSCMDCPIRDAPGPCWLRGRGRVAKALVEGKIAIYKGELCVVEEDE